LVLESTRASIGRKKRTMEDTQRGEGELNRARAEREENTKSELGGRQKGREAKRLKIKAARV